MAQKQKSQYQRFKEGVANTYGHTRDVAGTISRDLGQGFAAVKRDITPAARGVHRSAETIQGAFAPMPQQPGGAPRVMRETFAIPQQRGGAPRVMSEAFGITRHQRQQPQIVGYVTIRGVVYAQLSNGQLIKAQVQGFQ